MSTGRTQQPIELCFSRDFAVEDIALPETLSCSRLLVYLISIPVLLSSFVPPASASDAEAENYAEAKGLRRANTEYERWASLPLGR